MKKCIAQWKTMIGSSVTVGELPVEKKFSTGRMRFKHCMPVEKKFSTIWWVFHRFFHRSVEKLNDFEPILQLSVPLLTYSVPMPYVGFVQHPAPWASTLRTVTQTARTIWMNSARSTVRIWSTPWSRFFLHQKTSTVLWLHWKMRWTVSEPSTGHSGISKGALD